MAKFTKFTKVAYKSAEDSAKPVWEKKSYQAYSDSEMAEWSKQNGMPLKKLNLYEWAELNGFSRPKVWHTSEWKQFRFFDNQNEQWLADLPNVGRYIKYFIAHRIGVEDWWNLKNEDKYKEFLGMTGDGCLFMPDSKKQQTSL